VKNKRRIILILGIGLIISLIFNFWQFYQKLENNRVVRVVDGDSFELKDGRRIRLLSLDAPEINRCYYSQARERLTGLILNKKIRLKNITKDNYGRLLSNIFVGNIFVNKIILKEGLARFYYVKSPYYEDLKAISQKAKDNKIGIYSPLCRTTSQDANCQIKANNNHGQKYFFTPECRTYEQVIVDESFGDQWFCEEEEAIKAGFTKAKGC
jgi:endonuclease YncB( thermonuclease family)